MTVSGVIQSLIYRNSENFYTVARVMINNVSTVAVGYFPSVTEGESIILEGEFKVNAKYGEQFVASSVKIDYPTTNKGIEKFLASGLFVGIGPITAKALVDAFGDKTLEVIEFAPHKLPTVKGISAKKAEALRQNYLSKKAMQDVIIYLGAHNVSMSLSIKIFKKYGELTKAIMEQNPYRLIMDVDGVGFITADTIAEKIGLAPDSEDRIKAGILYSLDSEANQKGSTLLPEKMLYERVEGLLKLRDIAQSKVEDFLFAQQEMKNLEVSSEGLVYLGSLPSDDLGGIFADYYLNYKKEGSFNKSKMLKELSARYSALLIDNALRELILNNSVVEMEYKAMRALMHRKLYSVELGIAQRLVRLSKESIFIGADVSKFIDEFEKQNSIKLHLAQREAVSSALNCGGLIITGGPGTGKTTIIKCIIYILDKAEITYALCAPTGRAGKRMSMATGVPAKTIHRLLGVRWGDADDKLAYEYSEKNPLKEDVIIVDEVSMCDVYIFYTLIKALKAGARLILVGDKDQLPSVGAGSVLSDIIESKIFPISYLTEIYRQSKDSYIISNAHLVNKGEMPNLDNRSKDFFYMDVGENDDVVSMVKDLYMYRLPRFLNVQTADIQVLAPLKRGASGVRGLNEALQQAANPSGNRKKEIVTFDDDSSYDDRDENDGTVRKKTIFREGDRIMQVVNDYDIKWTKEENGVITTGEGLFNGEIGIIEKIDVDKNIIALFEDNKRATYSPEFRKELSLAYAISIHKSQGSEFEAGIIVIGQGNPVVLTKNLLYTAITRAKRLVMLVGKRRNIEMMIKNNYVEKRYTALVQFISEAENE